ncbi:mitochondrial inner membrane protease subunit 2-like [Senna tora]|uniref:Mitochondrial inner membrane protease subunit 2-like n=1 Tax=Senna tora TaxID=362788 RepID=A0A834SPE3_9FABA|nr:mitochondrial inner membrane protease subunit 2-like [Senna tora]
MASLSARFRYLFHKLDYSTALTFKSHQQSRIAGINIASTLWKNFLGKLTYLHCNEGEEMAPTITGNGVTLVRKLPLVDPMRVSVGDVVVFNDPENKGRFLIRRLAAMEGNEMVSSDENDEPFTLEKNECWVTADNESMDPKEANDSRVFGPIKMTNIVGRVIYSMQTVVDHGPVLNSDISQQTDSSVLAVELDVDEMARNLKS